MSVFIVFVPLPRPSTRPPARTALLNMNFRHVNRLSALPTSSFCPRCRFFKQFMTLCRLAFSCKIWITKRISNWQNPKRIKRGGVKGRVGRRKQKRVWVRESGKSGQIVSRGSGSHSLRVTLTRAGQVLCSCFPTRLLPPFHTQSQLYLCAAILSSCVCQSECVSVCVLGGSALFFYALRRIAHKTFLLLI